MYGSFETESPVLFTMPACVVATAVANDLVVFVVVVTSILVLVVAKRLP
jgi:hypothetical protein